MLWHKIIFLSIMQVAYRIANVCFLFGKYESLKSEIFSRVFIYNNGWKMQIFPRSPWHVYLSFKTLKTFRSFSVMTFVKATEIHIKVVTVVNCFNKIFDDTGNGLKKYLS